MLTEARKFFAFPALLILSACGTFVPDKNPLLSGAPDNTRADNSSAQARYEDLVVRHVNCELARGLANAAARWDSPWVTSNRMGTTITLTMTALQQGGAGLGASITDQFHNAIKILPTASGGNVVTPQSFSLGLGVTGAANSSRTETIQWTQNNSDLLGYYKRHKLFDCSKYQNGIMIDGNLKIDEFIDDNVRLSKLNNLNAAVSIPNEFIKTWGTNISAIPLYNTFTDDLNFVAAFGGNINPTWKLAALTANTPISLLGTESTYTNDLVITIGQLQPHTFPYQLGGSGQVQHQTRVGANAISTSIQAQGHQ